MHDVYTNASMYLVRGARGRDIVQSLRVERKAERRLDARAEGLGVA